MTHPITQLADAKAVEYGRRFMAGEPLAKLLREYGNELLRLAREPSGAVRLAMSDATLQHGETRAGWRAGIDALRREVEEE